MERKPSLDRPEITGLCHDWTLPQLVGFDEGVYNLDYAIEQGLIEEGEVKREQITMEEAQKRALQKLRSNAKRPILNKVVNIFKRK